MSFSFKKLTLSKITKSKIAVNWSTNSIISSSNFIVISFIKIATLFILFLIFLREFFFNSFSYFSTWVTKQHIIDILMRTLSFLNKICCWLKVRLEENLKKLRSYALWRSSMSTLKFSSTTKIGIFIYRFGSIKLALYSAMCKSLGSPLTIFMDSIKFRNFMFIRGLFHDFKKPLIK